MGYVQPDTINNHRLLPRLTRPPCSPSCPPASPPQVYSPELLQNRISILRDTAILLDKTGQGEAAIDYATGALVNAQVGGWVCSAGGGCVWLVRGWLLFGTAAAALLLLLL